MPEQRTKAKTRPCRPHKRKRNGAPFFSCRYRGNELQRFRLCRGPGGGSPPGRGQGAVSPLPPEASASLFPRNRFQYFPRLIGVLFDLGDEGVGAGKGDFAAQAFDEGDFKMLAVKIGVEIKQVRRP